MSGCMSNSLCEWRLMRRQEYTFNKISGYRETLSMSYDRYDIIFACRLVNLQISAVRRTHQDSRSLGSSPTHYSLPVFPIRAWVFGSAHGAAKLTLGANPVEVRLDRCSKQNSFASSNNMFRLCTITMRCNARLNSVVANHPLMTEPSEDFTYLALGAIHLHVASIIVLGWFLADLSAIEERRFVMFPTPATGASIDAMDQYGRPGSPDKISEPFNMGTRISPCPASQLLLQALAWGFFGAIKIRDQIALPFSNAVWVQDNPHFNTFGGLLILSVFLCNSQISIIVSLPPDVLGGFRWTTLLTPVTVVIPTPLFGHEIDLSSPNIHLGEAEFEDCSVGNVNGEGDVYSATAVDRLESGYAAAKGYFGYPAILTFLDQSFNVSIGSSDLKVHNHLTISKRDFGQPTRRSNWDRKQQCMVCECYMDFCNHQTLHLSAPPWTLHKLFDSAARSAVHPVNDRAHILTIRGYAADVSCSVKTLGNDTIPTLYFDAKGVTDPPTTLFMPPHIIYRSMWSDCTSDTDDMLLVRTRCAGAQPDVDLGWCSSPGLSYGTPKTQLRLDIAGLHMSRALTRLAAFSLADYTDPDKSQWVPLGMNECHKVCCDKFTTIEVTPSLIDGRLFSYRLEAATSTVSAHLIFLSLDSHVKTGTRVYLQAGLRWIATSFWLSQEAREGENPPLQFAKKFEHMFEAANILKNAGLVEFFSP
ncbi:hypothetical protein B0H19DRAFT_1239716 [Mycena capillaripes]|nr:hypothetical protein B0H19DRAFT_1239716 [Mycena capillaripes]